jgi:hypothetical protein
MRRAAWALAAILLAAIVIGGGGAHPRVVVTTTGGAQVADADASGGFALAYRHSVYREPAQERFQPADGGGFDLVAIASPSQAVLDYYEIDGERVREGEEWVLRPAAPPHFETMALAGTEIGRRTLVAGGELTPLWRADGAAHLRIAVER